MFKWIVHNFFVVALISYFLAAQGFWTRTASPNPRRLEFKPLATKFHQFRWFLYLAPPRHEGEVAWFVKGKKAWQKCCTCSIFGKSIHFGKNGLFEGVRVKKRTQFFEAARHIHKEYRMQKIWSARSFQPSGVAKAIYNGLCEVATTN